MHQSLRNKNHTSRGTKRLKESVNATLMELDGNIPIQLYKCVYAWCALMYIRATIYNLLMVFAVHTHTHTPGSVPPTGGGNRAVCPGPPLLGASQGAPTTGPSEVPPKQGCLLSMDSTVHCLRFQSSSSIQHFSAARHFHIVATQPAFACLPLQ